MDEDGLEDTLYELVRRQGPTDVAALVRQARRERRDASIDAEGVREAVFTSFRLVGLPDGRVDHILHVLDGAILAQRVHAPTRDRRDLWTTVALAPLLNVLYYHPLPLASGGELTQGEHVTHAVVGPQGWLPDVPAFGLVGLHWRDGELAVRQVSPDELPPLAEQRRVSELVARHYRRERWYGDGDDLETRGAEVIRAVTLAALDDPTLFGRPMLPLDELLHDPLEQQADLHHWREMAAWRMDGNVSFQVSGMPNALYHELDARARRYGMSFDQYVIAVLGHLAWRTPFAEDMEPWESWLPDSRPRADLRVAHPPRPDNGTS
jgi:hypothetical protein